MENSNIPVFFCKLFEDAKMQAEFKAQAVREDFDLNPDEISHVVLSQSKEMSATSPQGCLVAWLLEL